MRVRRLALCVALGGSVSLMAQEPTEEWTIDVDPPTLTLEVGETRILKATVRDANGHEVEDATVVFYSRTRQSVEVSREGRVDAHRPGSFTLVALVPRDAADTGARPAAVVRVEIPVTVPMPPISRLTFTDLPPKFYVGTEPRFTVTVVDATGVIRPGLRPVFTTSDPGIAVVDRFGFATLHRPGALEVTATIRDVVERVTVEVERNPMTALALQSSADTAATGEVVRFSAITKDARGLSVRSVPVRFAVSGETDPAIVAAGASAHIGADGRFVAERSGTYTVVATSGAHSATRSIEITRRDVGRRIEVVGRGKVLDRHTSDLWIWEGADGRDYAMTGTWGADGAAYIWDVTDPSDITKVHEVQVDARTVNDVKVSEDGEVAVISREGASDRKNGIVILGVGNPREGVPVLSEFTDQLTGGVHNVFIAEDHVFALSAGRRYDVISIKDPRNPTRVGRFELDTPGHGIHDVWVSDGVAFSSNWGDGVVAVDVGGGGKGGTPERPVELGRYVHPSGWNHAAFPYRSQSTGQVLSLRGRRGIPLWQA